MMSGPVHTGCMIVKVSCTVFSQLVDLNVSHISLGYKNMSASFIIIWFNEIYE